MDVLNEKGASSIRVEAIAIRVEAIAIRVEVVATSSKKLSSMSLKLLSNNYRKDMFEDVCFSTVARGGKTG